MSSFGDLYRTWHARHDTLSASHTHTSSKDFYGCSWLMQAIITDLLIDRTEWEMGVYLSFCLHVSVCGRMFVRAGVCMRRRVGGSALLSGFVSYPLKMEVKRERLFLYFFLIRICLPAGNKSSPPLLCSALLIMTTVMLWFQCWVINEHWEEGPQTVSNQCCVRLNKDLRHSGFLLALHLMIICFSINLKIFLS